MFTKEDNQVLDRILNARKSSFLITKKWRNGVTAFASMDAYGAIHPAWITSLISSSVGTFSANARQVFLAFNIRSNT